jgi:GNAT superfamily N-acetyltransferase
MTMGDAIEVRCLQTIGEREIQGLGDVLIDCVEGGASVSFMLPMTRAKADAFWRSVAASVTRGERLVLAAEDESGAIVGTAQVILAQPENQPHRGDLAKMLVHRRARRRGIGAALLAAAERAALDAGKTLLVLDTASDDAERLYARGGWQRCGEIPGYALWPDGGPCATTYYFKFLRDAPGVAADAPRVSAGSAA